MKFGVIGVGRFGYYVASTLAEHGMEVIAVDRSESIIASIQDKVTQAICIRATDEESLRSIGMDELDTVIVAMGENFAESILVTALLKQNLKIPHVIARAVSQIHKDILQRIGADQIILPEKEEGIRLGHNLSLNFKSVLGLTPDFSISQIRAPKAWLGKTAATIQDKTQVICMGKKIGDSVEPIASSYVFAENDILYVSGLNDDLEKVAR